MSLGRGLGTLISSTTQPKKDVEIPKNDSDISPGERIWQVPISAIKPAVNQPRKHFKIDELQELAASVKEHGILQPLLVKEKTDGGYELIAGERRYRAAKIVGLATVPVVIKKIDAQKTLEIALIENIQRQDLNALEEAFAYRRLMDEFGLTQEAVAQKVGKSRSAVANIVRLLDLPNQIQTALVEGKISMSQGRTLLGLENEEQQLAMLSSMLGQKITVRELEREVGKVHIHKNPKRRDANAVYLEDKLRTVLGAKVSISQKGEQGSITINYHSLEEMNEIINKIVGSNT
jgi:ParB family chromosome partitioning protein